MLAKKWTTAAMELQSGHADMKTLAKSRSKHMQEIQTVATVAAHTAYFQILAQEMQTMPQKKADVQAVRLGWLSKRVRGGNTFQSGRS